MNWTFFFAMLAFLETRGEKDPDNFIRKDEQAYGRYQIRQAYLDDSNEFAGTDFTLKDCLRPSIAEIVIVNYMKRYAPMSVETGNYIRLARIHLGGPRGNGKESTEEYGRKAQAWLDEQKENK